jgi:TolA-binding protein
MWTGVALGAAAGVVLMLTASLVFRWARPDERRPSSHGMQAPSVVEPPAPSASSPGEAEKTPMSARARTVEADAPVPMLDGPTPSLEMSASVRPTPRGPSAQPRVPESSVAAVPEPTPTPATDAAQLFDRATEATRRGDDEAALSAFEALRRGFPSSREAKASWVLAGRLQLDRSQPALALECFDHYLDAPGSAPLVPEALLGRATALERLGREAEAREQHRDIVRRFPRSSAAMQARARLDGGESP